MTPSPRYRVVCADDLTADYEHTLSKRGAVAVAVLLDLEETCGPHRVEEVTDAE